MSGRISNDISQSKPISDEIPLPAGVPLSLTLNGMLSPLISSKYSTAVFSVPTFVRDLFKFVLAGTKVGTLDSTPILKVELSS